MSNVIQFSRFKRSTHSPADVANAQAMSYTWFAYNRPMPTILSCNGQPVVLKNGDLFGVKAYEGVKLLVVAKKGLGLDFVMTLTPGVETVLRLSISSVRPTKDLVMSTLSQSKIS